MKASQKQAAAPQGAAAALAKTTAPVTTEDADEDDDDEGRAALVGKKRKFEPVQGKKKKKVLSVDEDPRPGQEEGDEAEPVVAAAPKQAPAKGRKKATSYLDEILAQRSKKRKNK